MALHHFDPGEKIQLSSRASPAQPRTAALVKTDRFEAVRVILHANEEISDHSVAGYTTLLCLEGAVTLKCPEPVDLTAGDWIYIERRQQHSMRAIEDSSLLMTIHFD